MKKIEISHRTIIFTVLFLLFLWFLYYIRDIILVLFVALLVMAILNPTVTKLSKYKIPRGISVALVYILGFSFFSLIIASIAPVLVEQTTKLVNNLPAYFQSVGFSNIVNEELIRESITQLGSIPGQAVKFGISIFSNVLAVFSVFMLAFYLLVARDKLGKVVESIVGVSKGKSIVSTVDLLEHRLGGWARGQIFLMIIVGLAVFVGLSLLGIPYSLSLGLIAGLLEIVPNLGPVLASIPAVVIGFGISPFTGLATICLYVLVQQIENYVIVPKVMQKSTGVNPVIILISIAIGLKIAGFVGVLISVPVYICLQVILKEYFSRR